MSDEFVVTERRTETERVRHGPMVSVTGYDFRDVAGTAYWVPKKNLGTYAFVVVKDGLADVERGEIPDTDRTPVICVGSHYGKHYWSSTDETVPVDVLAALETEGYQLIRDVAGGWDSWDGRPEFSTSYIDYTDADVVDHEAEIDERSAEQ